MTNSTAEQATIISAHRAASEGGSVLVSSELMFKDWEGFVLEDAAKVFLTHLVPGLISQIESLERDLMFARGESPLATLADPLEVSESTPGYYDSPGVDYIKAGAQYQHLLGQVHLLARRALAHLVVEVVVPAFVAANDNVAITLHKEEKNPTALWLVDGLTSNEHRLVGVEVNVSGARVADALRSAWYHGDPTLPTGRPHESVLVSGLRGLIGREVTVMTLGAPETYPHGHLGDVRHEHLCLFDDGIVTVVPMGAVLGVSTRQLSEDETRLAR